MFFDRLDQIIIYNKKKLEIKINQNRFVKFHKDITNIR